MGILYLLSSLLIRTWTRSYHYGMEMSFLLAYVLIHQDPQAEGYREELQGSKSIEIKILLFALNNVLKKKHNS